MIPPATLLAGWAADAGAGDLPIAVFAQYGVLGVITALLIMFARGAYQREKDRADQEKLAKEQLYQLMLDQVIPLITESTSALKECTGLLAAMQREREIDQLTRRVSLARREDES